MKRYLVEGRVIPERVDFNVPRIDYTLMFVDEQSADCQVYVWKSKIFAHVQAPDNVEISNLRNALFTLLGNLINYAGFHKVLGISYELDSITDVDTKETTVFGVEGFAFVGGSEFGDSGTFFRDAYDKELALSSELLSNKYFNRATFELRNSIRYPDFTALHCRLAIEAIRNYFDENEGKAWPKLRAALKIREATLREFEDIANLQRHGRNAPQTWEQRRRCMQVVWEVTYRFTRLLNNDPSLADAPEL